MTRDPTSSPPKKLPLRRILRGLFLLVVGTALTFFVQQELSREASRRHSRNETTALRQDARAIDELMTAGRYTDALDAAREALERCTGSHCYFLREKEGDALVALGRVPEAIRAFRDCVDSEPLGYWSPWMKLAGVQERAGEIDDAQSTYEDLLRRYPGHEDARENLERLRRTTASAIDR